jgi:hypothetical protein
MLGKEVELGSSGMGSEGTRVPIQTRAGRADEGIVNSGRGRRWSCDSERMLHGEWRTIDDVEIIGTVVVASEEKSRRVRDGAEGAIGRE